MDMNMCVFKWRASPLHSVHSVSTASSVPVVQ